VGKAEKWSVVVILTLMTLLPAAEAVVRRLLQDSIPGAVLYTQHLTLWVGFVGALIATGSGQHLSLATGEMIPKGPLRDLSRVYVGALAGGVCALLAYASVRQVHDISATSARLPALLPELVRSHLPVWEGGLSSFLHQGPREWWSEVVMPVALGLMTLRFAHRASERWAMRLVTLGLVAALCALGLLSGHADRLVVPGAIAILLGVLLGAPVFVAMSGLAMLLFFAEGTPIATVPDTTFRLVASASLPAIPLLTAAGYILAEGGASRRLLRLARALIGWAPGGLAVMICVVLAGFTTFTGGSGVTILALGGLVLPMLVSEKYPEGFSLGLVTSSGSLGLLFPPSLPVILYAVVAKASIEELYIAGFIPGLILVLAVAAYGVIVGVRTRAPRQKFDPMEAARALWEAKWELAVPAIVLLAIFTSFATIVEASALSVVAAVVSQSFIFKDLHWRRELPGVLAHSATLVGAVLILLGVAMSLTDYLVMAEVPAAVLGWTRAHIQSPTIFLLALNGALLVLGSVLEIYSAIIVLAPLLAPMAAAYGIDPLHMGIIFLANLELGFLFPPMGLNLILSSNRFGQPLTRLYKVSAPFLAIMAASVLLITYVPQMTNGVLHWVRGKSVEQQRHPSPQEAPSPAPNAGEG
jgi:tripartite ATP-independent transporter DctM subunit